MKHFSTVTAVFVSVLVISNTIAVKLFEVGPFVFSGAEFIFPISYIFGDILVEVYGYARSRKAIWTAFFVLIAMALVYWVVGLLPPAPGWENQDAYMRILGLVPRITFASIVAFWAGEFSNSYVLAKMKILTRGKHLWTRTISSTIVGQSVDTLLFTVIAFYGLIPGSTLFVLGLSGYGLKVAYEIVATPITYKIVNFLKREESLDHYDTKTKFNPFVFRTTGK